MTSEFVHLHVHTQYSLLDGSIRFKDLFEQTKAFNIDSVAITDHGTMFNCVEFHQMAKTYDLNPIIGCECYVAPRKLTDKSPLDKKSSHLVLLAENMEGYVNLCKLASIAQMEGFYYKPRIDLELLAKNSKGLIGLSACLAGEIPRLIESGNIKAADEAALKYLEIFGENNFYLEVQSNGIAIQDKVNEELLAMSKRLSIPLVATNDCHYLTRDDVRAHELLLCIQTGSTINDEKRFKFGTDELYYKSPEEMISAFKDYPDATANTRKIADRCNKIEFNFDEYHFPIFNNSDLSTSELFANEAKAGFEKRMEVIRKNNPDVDEKVYNDRLDYEIGIINKMGFPDYFLIVADFIKYAKDNNIPVGPGRGSAAGSIVAYSMNITDLDPIEFGLIFERFLNPARLSMPDIDVDFCINGREKVFKYVIDRYGGGDYVSQIITFGKLKTKAVIRDVGRALDIPLSEVDTIAKLVPDVLGISLDEALKQEPKFNELAEEKPEIAELLSVCKRLEGLPRHASTHAAGVVISDKPLYEYLPIFKGRNGEVVTQFDMTYVEKIGLVKFDFLGLRNLTIIESCLQLLKGQGLEAPDLLEIDFEDKKTFELLCEGDTTGVFQLESSGMKDLLVRLKPETFNDIIALVALYRPGPLDSGMVDSYVERKHGREPVEYIVPELEELTNETYGVILYQEQVMKIAGSLASYSMADADGLRKAMGKKIPEMMAKHRDLFLTGSKANNIPVDKATQIFDLMEKFGGYGFNKSHSAAYALICYQTAFLKAHYPVEFIAALLTGEMGNADGVVKFIAECKSHDIPILPPDINESNKEFNVINKKIRFGLAAIKNVGEGAIESIIETRVDGDYSSVFDFCERVNLRKVNKRVIEALIKCGAFDSTGAKRSQLMASLEDIIDHSQIIQKEKDDPQMSLFEESDGTSIDINPPELVDLEEWDATTLLDLEKESLGFYITGHPLDQFTDILKEFTSINGTNIHESSDKQAVRFGGTLRSNKVIRTRRGDMMSFALVEDLFSSIEVVVFSNVFEKTCDILIEDKPLIIQGEIQKDESSVKIIADTIIPMEKAEEIWSSSIFVSIDSDTIKSENFMKVREVFSKHPGSSKTFFKISNTKYDVLIENSDIFKVLYNKSLKNELINISGVQMVEANCTPVKIETKRKTYGKFKS